MIRLTLASASAAAILLAQADNVDDFVRAQMRQQNIPGLSLAVVQDGRVVKAEGYGLANLRLKAAATPETVYKIASVSKQFMAAGIMVLAQDGRLGLDDPISRYLDGAPSTWKDITIRHALTHTAGLVREPPGFDPTKVQSDADVIKSAYSRPLAFRPGEKHAYSNTGYNVLAEIIRRVSGRPWADFMTEKVFAPSGMSATRTTAAAESMPAYTRGYVDNDKLQDAPLWRAVRPGGAFVSTVLDLAKWDAVLYTDRVLTEASRRQMWSPVRLNDGSTAPYGFGWQLGNVKGRRMVHHSGGMPGARTFMARFVDDRLTIIVLMNLDDVDVDSVLYGLVALSLPSR